MKIDSGIVTINVERDGQEAGSFSFNPENSSFREKVCQMFFDFKDKDKELRQKITTLESDDKVDEYGMPTNIEAGIGLEREMCEWTANLIDEVFGEGTSKIAFGKEVNIFMLYQFMDEIAPYMEEVGDAKIERYIANREERRAAQKSKKVMK